jgi:hypothetical protein
VHPLRIELNASNAPIALISLFIVDKRYLQRQKKVLKYQSLFDLGRLARSEKKIVKPSFKTFTVAVPSGDSNV